MRYYTAVGWEPDNLQEIYNINRKELHPQGKRMCRICLKIKYFADFSVKRYHRNHDGSIKYTTYDYRCKECLKPYRALKTKETKSDLEKFCNRVAVSARCRCKEKDLAFDLDKTYLVELWNSQDGRCFYTGEVLDRTLVGNKTHPHIKFPSLDRKNPEMGYTKGNVAWCTYEVNRMKNDLPLEDFYSLCRTVLEIIRG